MDKGVVTGVVFVDLKKAFDSVNHKTLMKKCKHVGYRREYFLRYYKIDYNARI